jgi:hypothetical protein
MTRYKLVNGKRIKYTAEEEKFRDEEEKSWNDKEEERELFLLRGRRNFLLSQTDHYALSDVTMTDKMKTYRQELRDITKTYKSMNDKGFTFPTKPTDTE